MEAAKQAPDSLGPQADEAAVLSLVAARERRTWVAVCGSLISVPREVASTSWRRWRELQPSTRGPREPFGFDLGPTFYSDPFNGLRVLRQVIEPERWPTIAQAIFGGSVPTPFGDCALRTSDWSSVAFLGRDGTTDAHRLMSGTRRPVSAMSAAVAPPALPQTESTWSLGAPAHLQRGPDLGRIARERNLLHWPQELLGIDWLGGCETAPPHRFAIGRAHTDAWIADVVPDHGTERLAISICWDERRVDPLACQLLVRVERAGLSLMTRQIRLSDLPSRDKTVTSVEPRARAWRDRILEVHLPRGPRRAEWGIALLAGDGRLLDERPVARRVEQVEVEFRIADAAEAFSKGMVGDPHPPPTEGERDEAVALAVDLERQAQLAAAERRISSGSDLASYLRWRLSWQAGELLILDPFLFNADRQAVGPFLASFDRRIRILTGDISAPAERLVAKYPWLQARTLPRGKDSLHDRVWIVGETALLVGSSVATLMGNSGRTTSPTELSAGDARFWRDRFEAWWAAAGLRP